MDPSYLSPLACAVLHCAGCRPHSLPSREQEQFYRDCKGCLRPGGIIVTQNGHPNFEEYPAVALGNLAKVFTNTTLYQFCVPTYMGGLQSFGWASDDASILDVAVKTLEERWAATGITDCRVYTPAYGKASFVLPRWMQEIVDAAAKAAKGA